LLDEAGEGRVWRIDEKKIRNEDSTPRDLYLFGFGWKKSTAIIFREMLCL